jgi:hypothetical protein
MRCEFKHAVEYECTALEKAVAPVPAIVFNDVVRLRLDPEIERDHDDASDPTASITKCFNMVKLRDGIVKTHRKA